jgi:hypothetical protein
MERPPAGARIVLGILQRAKAGDQVPRSEQELSNAVHLHATRIWLTRFHREVLDNMQLKDMLREIDMFTKEWPRAAVEISKDIGWPDEPDTSIPKPHPEPVGLQSVPHTQD